MSKGIMATVPDSIRYIAGFVLMVNTYTEYLNIKITVILLKYRNSVMNSFSNTIIYALLSNTVYLPILSRLISEVLPPLHTEPIFIFHIPTFFFV